MFQEGFDDIISTYIRETWTSEAQYDSWNGCTLYLLMGSDYDHTLLKVSCVSVPNYMKSALALLHIKDRLVCGNVVVLNGSTLVEDQYLNKMIDRHRSRGILIITIVEEDSPSQMQP